MEEDTEPIEWGDMDPSFRGLLESTPAMLEAYKTLKNPQKMAKVDTTTSSFQPSTNVEVPEASLTVSLPGTVSVDNLKAVIQHYHYTAVQPPIDLLSKHIRDEVTHRLGRTSLLQYLGHQTMTSIEAEQQRRSVIIYDVPPFMNMSNISQNMHHLLSQADLNEGDVQSLSSPLATTCIPPAQHS